MEKSNNVLELVKICKGCKKSLPFNKFTKASTNKDKLSTYCNKCIYKKNKEWRENDKKNNPLKIKSYQKKYRDSLSFEELKERRLKTLYGISLNEYQEKFIQQDGQCAICKKELELNGKDTCVDHNHKNEKIRGLLCRWCNSGIGFFYDETKILLSAIDYLKYYE